MRRIKSVGKPLPQPLSYEERGVKSRLFLVPPSPFRIRGERLIYCFYFLRRIQHG